MNEKIELLQDLLSTKYFETEKKWEDRGLMMSDVEMRKTMQKQTYTFIQGILDEYLMNKSEDEIDTKIKSFFEIINSDYIYDTEEEEWMWDTYAKIIMKINKDPKDFGIDWIVK